MKRMPEVKDRKRGGQPGNENALKHGRYSPRRRAERRARHVAEFEEKQRKAAAWMASMPITDYGAICDAIAADKARRAGGLH